MEEEKTDITMIVEMHSNVLYRICFILLKSEQDVQKVLVSVFRHYIDKTPVFHKEVQRKAWLIQTALFVCRTFYTKQGDIEYEMIRNGGTQAERKMNLAIFLNLHRKYKTILFLNCVEGYDRKEISRILGITSHAVKRRLSQSECILKEMGGIFVKDRKAGIEEILADVRISEKMKDSIIWSCNHKEPDGGVFAKEHVWLIKKNQAPEYR